MSGIQYKISECAKNQENAAHNEQETQLIDIDPEMTLMRQFIDKDVKMLL